MQEIDEHAVASRQRMAESRKKLDEASEKFMAAIKQAEKEELTAFRWGATQTARAIRPMKTVRFKNTR